MKMDLTVKEQDVEWMSGRLTISGVIVASVVVVECGRTAELLPALSQ